MWDGGEVMGGGLGGNRSLTVMNATLFSLLLFARVVAQRLSSAPPLLPAPPRHRHPSWAALTNSNYL